MDYGIYVLLFFLLLIVGFAIWAFTDYDKKCKIFRENCQIIEEDISKIETIEEAEQVMENIKTVFEGTTFSHFKSQFQLYYHQVKGIKTILEKQHGITK